MKHITMQLCMVVANYCAPTTVKFQDNIAPCVKSSKTELLFEPIYLKTHCHFLDKHTVPNTPFVVNKHLSHHLCCKEIPIKDRFAI